MLKFTSNFHRLCIKINGELKVTDKKYAFLNNKRQNKIQTK